MSNTTIIDPAAPPTGTTLVFNMDSTTSSALYPLGGTAASSAFKFETVRDNHIRLRAGGADGAVAGEIVYYGMFKKGLGTVKVGDGRELKIEDWGTVTDRCMVVPIGEEVYVWNKEVEKSANGNLVTGVFYQAKVDDKIMATYTPSWLSAHLSSSFGATRATPIHDFPKTLTRAHIHFAPEVDEKAYPSLLLSLSLFKATVLKNAKPSVGERMLAMGVGTGIST